MSKKESFQPIMRNGLVIRTKKHAHLFSILLLRILSENIPLHTKGLPQF